MMSEPEEMLANALNLSGGASWHRLQGTITSQKTVNFEINGEKKTLSMPGLINLRSHPDASVRERAYKLEQETWETLKEPLAACMNGIKGEVITLDAKRGYKGILDSSLELARIDEQTLDAMHGALFDYLPMFKRYHLAKAKHLGIKKLPWWGLFAPLGSSTKEYSFDQAKEMVLSNFADFSPELADFARNAFEKNWIDAESRPGKRGGAFCMGIAGVKESRVMTNYDGSLNQVMTIAHELGHGFHSNCMYKADRTPLQFRTPATLSETASIMNETIMFHALLKNTSNRDEELALLETKIQGDTQTTVDILSRFIFEKEVFTRRAKGVLSADEISQIMLDAQMQTYGDGLDTNVLNKYAWTWKPHYYSTSLSFYNFPYTFGLLFGTGLYAVYQERGKAFIPDYKKLLISTGEAPAAELAARFGIDIRSKEFWASSLEETAKLLKRYEEL